MRTLHADRFRLQRRRVVLPVSSERLCADENTTPVVVQRTS